LRIGDFYNTKIIMENVNIDYEPLVWDLNPEGIGVQPMIANVDISFKFLGGSSLFGPINKLQNALSFNYFANTHVYDPRADYIAKKAGVSVGTLAENDASISTLEVNSNNLKATEPSSYVIFDGVAKYEPELGRLLSQISDENNKEVDQVKAEEKVNGGIENSVQTSTPDEVIFSNSALLGKYFVRVDNTNDDKLSGSFFVYGGGDLSKKYKAKIKIMLSMTSLDVATFTIGEDDSKPNNGNFTTTKAGWKEILNQAVDRSDDSVYFQVTIEGIPEKFGSAYAVARFDCPEYNLLPGSLADTDDWKMILKNPCCECYPDGYTSNMTFILNGQECSKSGNTGC
jgi:hypothetical protein